MKESKSICILSLYECNSGSKYKQSQYLGVTQNVSSVCPSQVFHWKTETREDGRVTHKCCL